LIAAVAFVLLARQATPVTAASPCPPADASLAGMYTLHGVMEVGSQIELRADGRFAYMLAYGNIDEFARGCWSRKARSVALIATEAKASPNDPMMFRRLELTLTPEGELLRRFDGAVAGRYARH
jgi:hypothetical protein